MLATDLTLGSDVYTLSGNDLVKSTRGLVTEPTAGTETELTISKSQTKIDGLVNDRRLVRIDRSVLSETGTPVKASVYLVINQPKSSVFTAAQIRTLCVSLATFITASSNGHIDKVLNGEL